MNVWLKRISPQPLTGIVALALGCLVLGAAWRAEGGLSRVSFAAFLTWLFLIGATISAAQFQIHLRNNTKLMVITLPLYLMAALFSPLLAAVGAGFAMLVVTLLLRPKLGTYVSDMMTTIGRWIVVVWLGSYVVHLPHGSVFTQFSMLLLAALLMFVSDLIGTAFEVAGITGEPPLHLVRVLFRQLYVPESVQYVLGIVGTVAAQQDLVALLLLAVPAPIIYLAFKRAKEMQDSTCRLLEGLADAIDLRDSYTGGHSRRVHELCRQILKQLSLTGLEGELILSAARVHDIGKIGVPDEILQKTDKLTPAERKVIESHVEIGAQLLQRYSDFARGKEFVRHHHERWDGKGYPCGLKGMEIPLGARVIAVADSFDAMTSDRPYRRAFTPECALRILEEGSGTQWDPHIVQVFLATRAMPVKSQNVSSLPATVDSLQAAL